MKFILLIINSVLSFSLKKVDLCIVGANSGLGKELIYQAAIENDKTVLALTSKNDLKKPFRKINLTVTMKNPYKKIKFIEDEYNEYFIKKPYRGDGFIEKETNDFIESENIIYDNYWSKINIEYKNIIFCTNAKPFEKDYSDRLTSKFLQDLPEYCESISLVSLYGIGNTLKRNDKFGVQFFNRYYLEDVYRAKEKQEEIINNYRKKCFKKYIYRPMAPLSYGKVTLLNHLSRETLAKEILKKI